MNYYRRFVGDYARDTRHLSLEEHGAYNLLLDHLYATEKPIPTIEAAWRICQVVTRIRTRGSTSGQKVVMDILTNFFVLGPKGYTHKRYEEELNHAESRRKAAIENGKKGGRPKPSGLATANPEESSPDSRLQTPEGEADRFSPNPTLMQKLGVSLSLWATFKKMRERIKRPLVAGGEDFIFTELLELQSNGENPAAVLEQAIRTSSYALYPARKEKEDGKLDPKKRTERNLRNAGLAN